MKLQPKLYQTSLICLSILLAFELLMFSGLYLLVSSSEAEAHKYEFSMKIVKQANLLLKLYTEGGTALAFYAATGSPTYGKHFTSVIADVTEQKNELKDALKNDPVMLSQVEGLEHSLDRAADAFIQYKQDFDLNHNRADLNELRRQVTPVLKQTAEKLRQITERETAQADAAYPKSSQFLRENLKKALLCGFIVNIIVALLGLRFYTRYITRRLEVMVDNSLRLASGVALEPKVGGNDEIAYLDSVFHTMATVLEEAAAKEKAAAETTRQSEERIRMLIENMPVGLIAVDEQGAITSVNPRTSQIFGYEQQQMIGKHLQMLFADQQEEHPDVFMQILRQRAFAKTIELNAKRSNGLVFPSDVSLNQIETSTGLQLLANVQDMTDRHEAERLKREFVAMVSHDLRTPLTSLLGTLALLSTGAFGTLPEEAVTPVAEAEDEVERLMRLINDLLDVARIEAGQLSMTFDVVLLSDIIDDSVIAVKTVAEQRSIEIEYEDTDIELVADPDRIIQVLVNLLSNAIKFSPEKSKVEIAVQQQLDWVEVKIRDYGRGIPQEFTETIFERFKQVHATDASKKGGTGLGLPICKTIIEQHGGSIGVDSEVDQGSTFWFRLPIGDRQNVD